MKNLKKIAAAFNLLAIIFASCSTDGTNGNNEQQPQITAVYNARSAATATEDGAKVVLAWNNPSSGYYGAALSIAPAAGSLATPKKLGVSETTCTVTGLAADTSYVFTWKNLDSSGNETTTSVSLTVKTPEAGTKELTQDELQALLDAESKENIYEQILAGKTVAALLEKLSTEQKGSLFDEMAKDSTFLNSLTQEQKDAVSDGASDAKKAEIFNSLLASKTSVDFIKEILNKEGNETLRKSVKDYLVAELTQDELQALLDATDTTAPNKVTNLAAENLGEAVKLTWTDASDTDILAYEITYTEKSASRAVCFVANSIVIPQGTGKAVIAELTNGKTYTFTVKTVDKIGNKSAGQTVDCEVKALPAKGEEVPIPEGFVLVKAGVFNMGSEVGYDNNKPVHQVTLTKDFLMCENEVTQAEYETYCTYGGRSPSATYGDGDNYPAYYVSWYDAIVYCNKRSKAEGLEECYSINESVNPDDWGTIPTSSDFFSTWNRVVCDFTKNGYRLPTEAEWEYAARAGDTTTESLTYSGTNDSSSLGDYAWYSSNSSSKTHEVKGKTANSLGLYDMSGNLWEWCWDRWPSSGNYSDDESGVTDPTGTASGYYRVFRGGHWYDSADICAVSYRCYGNPDGCNYFIGFRVVRSSSN